MYAKFCEMTNNRQMDEGGLAVTALAKTAWHPVRTTVYELIERGNNLGE